MNENRKEQPTYKLAVLFVELVDLAFADVVLVDEIVLEAGNGIVILLPRAHLIDRSIRSRIITRAVVAQSIRHRFDQNWSRLFDGDVTGRSSRIINSKQIVTVNSDGDHSVGLAPGCYSIASILFTHGGADGVTVISTKKYEWNVENAGKVERSVGVSFAGCS